MERPKQALTASSRGAAAGAKASKVERGFKEETQTTFVRGEFELGPNIMAQVVGAPRLDLGKIVLVLRAPTTIRGLRGCQSLEVLVNARPNSALQLRRAQDLYEHKLEGDFDFQSFKPLAQQYPEFAVRACTTTWKFTTEQVDDLRKFLVMYSNLAKEESASGDGIAPVSETH
jgi:hypothetical protein